LRNPHRCTEEEGSGSVQRAERAEDGNCNTVRRDTLTSGRHGNLEGNKNGEREDRTKEQVPWGGVYGRITSADVGTKMLISH